jgi:8-oxo-dGTP pyrophosphatase MutT (NUDIX family)
MISYVVGIIFDELIDKVLLIRKNRPDWQVGKLNGVGGKIEQDETPNDAMVRECYEECGLLLDNWVLFDTYTDDKDYLVYFFTAIVPNLDGAYSCTDELVEIHELIPLFEENFGLDILVYPTNTIVYHYYTYRSIKL